MTADSTDPFCSVAILGSCVTRDIFNFDREKRFQLVDYTARSSIASAFSDTPFTNVEYSNIESLFQR